MQDQSVIYNHPRPHHDRVKHAIKIQQENKSEATANQKIAAVFTKYFGSMTMFYVLVIWMILWMTLATLSIWLFKFDKYPFPFLLFCSNLVQLWALPVLAVGQNFLSEQQEEHAKASAKATYDNTVESVKDEKLMIEHLDAQDTVLVKQTMLLMQLEQRLIKMQEDQQSIIQYFSHEIADLKIQVKKPIIKKTKLSADDE